MKKGFWSLYAPVYELAMRPDKKAYAWLYHRIPKVIKDKDVLEIATGPGMIAKHTAPAAKRFVATDYAEGMVAQAKKGVYADNLTFEVADAMSLPYESASFDVVIISNALHIVPDPEKALSEIRRVLKMKGILIAPNFVHEKGAGVVSRLWTGTLKLIGVRFAHEWTGDDYCAFLEQNGFRVKNRKTLKARFPILYAECTKSSAL